LGASTFATLKEKIKLRAGNRADLEAAGDSSLNYYGIWINSAYRQLCTQDNVLGLNKKLYFPQLMTNTSATNQPKTTTAGTAYVTTPNDALYIMDVYDTTHNVNLDWIPWREYLEYTDRTTTASRGDPTEWSRYGDNIYLHSTPQTTGDTMTIYYKKLVSDLSGTLTTDIGAEWDDVIVELASYTMFRWMHEYDKSKSCKEAFLEMSVGLAGIYHLEERDLDKGFGPSDAYSSR
jgi:hypothetical protein